MYLQNYKAVLPTKLYTKTVRSLRGREDKEIFSNISHAREIFEKHLYPLLNSLAA